MPFLSGSDDAAAVRALVDPALDAAALPDAVIYSPGYAPAVEAWLVRTYPAAATVTSPGTDWDAFKRAAMYLTAERIVGGGGGGKSSEKFGDEYAVSYTDNAGDRAAWLHAQAMAELDQFDSNEPAIGSGMFAAIRGRRP